ATEKTRDLGQDLEKTNTERNAALAEIDRLLGLNQSLEQIKAEQAVAAQAANEKIQVLTQDLGTAKENNQVLTQDLAIRTTERNEAQTEIRRLQSLAEELEGTKTE